jgi:ATP-dependent Clp protease adaptor protein ClpS
MRAVSTSFIVCATDSDVLERIFTKPAALPQPAPKLPPLYVVMIHNDDTTPQEFVMEVLKVKFGKGPQDAFNIMSKAHNEGEAPVVTLSRELAEAKAAQANSYARARQNPAIDGPMQLTFSAVPL